MVTVAHDSPPECELRRRAEEVAISDALTRLVRALEAGRTPDAELAAVCRLTGLSLADAADEGARLRATRAPRRSRSGSARR